MTGKGHETARAARPPGDQIDVSVVIPCLNEAGTIEVVVEKAHRGIEGLGLRGEVLVADNGSTDGSVGLAERLGARVVHVPHRGYGNALRFGMAEARGRMLVMGDADDTYDFGEIGPFVRALEAGADVVMGTRLPPGRMLPGSNPWLNRYVGTPVLTFILNRLFGTRIHDTNCGMRALTRTCFERLDLQASGMEFASEMVIKAGLHHVRMREVPVTLHPDRRTGCRTSGAGTMAGGTWSSCSSTHRISFCSSPVSWRSRSASCSSSPLASGRSTSSATSSTSIISSTAGRW